MILRYLKARAHAPLRVVGLPYSGASAAWLRAWAVALPEDIELVGCVYPGREVVPPTARLEALVPQLLEAVAPVLDRPYVVFGHSIGAWVGFELVRAIERAGLVRPRALLATGRHAPSMPARWTPITHLGDADFVRALMERYDSIPQVVLDDPGLLAMLLPGLRADMMMGERYRFVDDTPISCPLEVYGGADDGFVSDDELEAWRSHTSARAVVRMLRGGHFFVDAPENRELLLGRLVELVRG